MEQDFLSRISLVYNKLNDLESKEIFKSRLLYNLTQEDVYMNQMVAYYLPFKTIISFIDNHEKNVIFGAGKNGKLIASIVGKYMIDCFIDNGVSPGEQSIDKTTGLRIINPIDYFASKSMLESGVIVSPEIGFEEIETQLKEYGISESNIISFSNVLKKKNDEYFEDFLTHKENEVFVDAGVYDGNTTLDFCEWSKGKYKKIYMFEPSEDYYERFYNNVESIGNCEWIHKGLWSCETELSFFQRPDSDISTQENLDGIDTKYHYEEGNFVRIPVTSLDKSLKDEEVTFIKMDIEGSEIEAIKGARDLIKRCNPKLAICIYHKIEDIWSIPELILSINPNYKLYLRHYSMDMLDTVLYAIPHGE